MTSDTSARTGAPLARGRHRAAFTAGEWRSIAGMAGFILLLHVVGWGVLLLAVAPRNYALGTTGVLGAGVGLTAYMLGVRHAFDADHIASIDNTTRKLVGEGKPSVSAGFWFSLGHSSVVFGASLLLALGVRSVAGVVQDEGSQVGQLLGLIGTFVAGAFLVIIGLVNLVAVFGIARVFRRMRTGEYDEVQLEQHLNNRGFLARLLGRVTKRVSRAWHLYPVGLLMGLGFDTASQVALLVLAAGSAAFVLPWYAILVLPVLFAAGMSLFDAADGVFMSRAYGWAFLHPVRKVFYSLTVTVLSVVVALVVGVVVLVGLLTERLGIETGPLPWLASLDLAFVGFGVVGLFVLIWGAALAVWRFGRIEEKWSGVSRRDDAAPATE
ncbi:high-affinity nickel-transport protein [Kineococcus xinjiangensis]|uniref:Nickel/cobalt efflux system n=2 Tax=Kineococcus xinjiangensis TaxID=512762 RepID=A0A2S6INW1_9ACTN|nr:high-affinity nickel-transport protein [Kineococcus xinjiangensis]